MTLVVFGVDALDPDLIDPERHQNLVLGSHKPIDTIVSSTGSPSTHELWPTIITGLPPQEHGLILDDGVAWESPLLAYGSRAADYFLPSTIQTRLGRWLLNNTNQVAFRTRATYYANHDLQTVFDDTKSLAIGMPNYVVDPDSEDREHQLRRRMGELFERDPKTATGHVSADTETFYEQCMEMAMVRIARLRRALRGSQYELVFGYTSGLDLIGHVAHDRPELQERAYDELNEFIGELHTDLKTDDELLLVSDHGLQDGLHTEMAMVAATDPTLIESIESVLDVRAAVESELASGTHIAAKPHDPESAGTTNEAVQEQLEDLGYI